MWDSDIKFELHIQFFFSQVMIYIVYSFSGHFFFFQALWPGFGQEFWDY